MRTLIITGILLLSGFSASASNKVDDSFGVKEIEDSQAVLEGKVKDLKAGDHLYFVRPPYEFKVKSVDSDLDKVIVELPATHDLQKGNALLRTPTPQIKKFIQQESRLKEALSD